MSKTRYASLLILLILTARLAAAPQPQQKQPGEILTAAVARLTSILQPAPNTPPQTLTTQLKITRSDGLPKEVAGATIDLALQAPDKLLLSARVRDSDYKIGRDGQQLWIYTPAKKFGVIGSSEIPRFTADPKSLEPITIPPFSMPIAPEHLLMLPLLAQVELAPTESVDNADCDVIVATLRDALAERLGRPGATIQLAVRQSDSLPARIRYKDQKLNLEIQFTNTKLSAAAPADTWQLKSAPGDRIEKSALSHLIRAAHVIANSIGRKIPTLGPATGQRTVIAREGNGRLEDHDGTRVLFLKGTPEEMGRQHGTLLQKEIRDCTDHILYGVGVGSSFAKGRWFFGEIEEAHARLAPFISERYYREIDAIADAAGMHRQEARLSNFFPELFHCSGFAIANGATKDGKLYHGRVLDYMKGVGLEQNATVMVLQPEKGNAWINISYAGFVGSVTAMNAKHVAIGEMGGRGEGNWDGKPMAQLVREVMENANTLEEAVAIMRSSPRTCEYYYVISDGKTRKAVGVKATPTIFETVEMGAYHPQLTTPVKDTVLLSADDRYKALVKRVEDGFGKFDADSARALMDPPVCMNSNIHSVLFAPETLDLWVANADSQNVASKTRYTHYNLREMLDNSAAAEGKNEGNPGKKTAVRLLP